MASLVFNSNIFLQENTTIAILITASIDRFVISSLLLGEDDHLKDICHEHVS